jgi:hypothetical protein
VRDLPAVLAIVRASPLAPWITGVGPQPDCHDLEAAARRRWRCLVTEVADWMPLAWQPSVAWCAVLADLPALAHLGQRSSAAARDAGDAWVREDPLLQGLADPALGGADRALRALVADAAGDARRVAAGWRARWERLLPEPLAAHPLLLRLVHMLDEHAHRFATAHPADAWPLRRALAGRVTLLMRRAAVDPAQAFAFVTLGALEYERLRAELVPRCALPRRALAA